MVSVKTSIVGFVHSATFLIVVGLVNDVNPLFEGSTGNLLLNKLVHDPGKVYLERAWIAKSFVPSYLWDFIRNFKEESANDIQKLLRGVENKKCIDDMTIWVKILTDGLEGNGGVNLASEENKWVVQMIDAWGKIPEGILSGHVSAHGDFDQCVQLTATPTRSFDGLYCSVYAVDFESSKNMTPDPGECQVGDRLVSTKDYATQEALSLEEFFKILTFQTKSWLPLLPSIGICMPNSCSLEDVQQIFYNGVYEATKSCSGFPWPATINCVDRHKPSFDAAAGGVIILLGFLVALGIVAGSLDYFYDNYIAGPRPNSTPYKYLMAFSIYSNTKKLLSTRKSAEDLGCIHGIRFLSTAWVVLAHTYFAFIGGPLWNTIDMKNIYQDWTSLAVINGTFSVDTFFTMSGFLAAYGLLKTMEKTKGKINLIMFYVHRYIRLTPVYIILVGISATLMNYVGNGPSWFAVKTAEDACRKNWWTNILYINNLVNTDEMCNGESWYLANDMQFYILTPFIVYPIWRWETMGLLLLTIYSIMSCIAQVLVVRYAPAPPAMAVTGQSAGMDVTEIYYRPWSRIAPYLVGVWLGWVMYKTKGKKPRLPVCLVAGLWICCTGLALTLIFGIYPWFDINNEIPRVTGYLYAGLSRFSWGVVVSWIIFACVNGYGGFMNIFLSWKGFMPLGRLSFCIYLTSVHLQVIFHNRLTVPLKWDKYIVIHIYFAHMVMTCMTAFLCTILFESPFIIIQKLIFEGRTDKATVVAIESGKPTDLPPNIVVSGCKNNNPNNAINNNIDDKSK